MTEHDLRPNPRRRRRRLRYNTLAIIVTLIPSVVGPVHAEIALPRVTVSVTVCASVEAPDLVDCD